MRMCGTQNDEKKIRIMKKKKKKIENFTSIKIFRSDQKKGKRGGANICEKKFHKQINEPEKKYRYILI